MLSVDPLGARRLATELSVPLVEDAAPANVMTVANDVREDCSVEMEDWLDETVD